MRGHSKGGGGGGGMGQRVNFLHACTNVCTCLCACTVEGLDLLTDGCTGMYISCSIAISYEPIIPCRVHDSLSDQYSNSMYHTYTMSFYTCMCIT